MQWAGLRCVEGSQGVGEHSILGRGAAYIELRGKTITLELSHLSGARSLTGA